MKTFHLPLIVGVIALVFSNCKKEVNDVSATESSTVISKLSSTNSKWIGYYRASGQQDILVEDVEFITNGYARLGNSPYDDYFTSIELTIPAEKTFNADSLIIKLRVKNPGGVEGSVYPYDVIVPYNGTTDSGRMQFSALPANIFLGSTTVYTTDLPFVKIFNNWSPLVIGANKTLFSGYEIHNNIGWALGHNPFGRLRNIVITFKGSGTVDWVKLLGKKSNQLIMEENFDGPGSNVIWYQ